jgi:hypothetical protein
MAMLRRLAQIGMALAERLQVEVMDGTAAQAGVDPGLAFSRIARAVRLTLALQARFEDDHQAPESWRAKARADRASEYLSRCGRGQMLKDEARDLAGQVIRAEARERGDDSEVERLLDAVDERLNEHGDADLADHLLDELVKQICRDLGVPFDAERWFDEDGEPLWEDDDDPPERPNPHSAHPGERREPDHKARSEAFVPGPVGVGLSP